MTEDNVERQLEILIDKSIEQSEILEKILRLLQYLIEEEAEPYVV